MSKHIQVIRLLKEILYVLEADYLPSFIQLDRNEGGMVNQIKETIRMLELKERK